MKFKLLLLLELKNTLKKIPHIILGVVALIAVIGAITFCGTKYLYNLDMDITINLALVTEDDSKLMTTITNMVTEADSIKEYVNFIPCTRDELPSLLDNGGVYAGIILQEDAAKDIMSGKNTPIEIVFPKNSGFEAAIISEMASAVASMLSTAQAGVYTSIDFYNAHYKNNAKDEMIERLNLTYIVTVLFRGNTFNDHVISATGNISLILYYVIAAIAMFILFYSINSATIYSRYGIHLSNKLINNNVGILGQMFIKYLSILTSYGFLLIILLPILFYFFEMSIAFSLILPIILAIFCISALTLLIYEVFSNNVTCILFIFLFSVFVSFISGCIIPALMLPDTITDISCFFPIKHIMSILTNIVLGNNSIQPYILTALFIPVYFLLSVVIKYLKIKRTVE